MGFIENTFYFLLMPCAIAIGSFLVIIFFVQKSILNYIFSADLQVEEFEGIFYIKDKNLKNNKKIKSIAKDFNSLKKNKLVRNVNEKLDTDFNVFLQDYWLNERLLFTSEVEENVQMEIDHIKELIKKIQLKKITSK